MTRLSESMEELRKKVLFIEQEVNTLVRMAYVRPGGQSHVSVFLQSNLAEIIDQMSLVSQDWSDAHV